jgi:hypothetical protein
MIGAVDAAAVLVFAAAMHGSWRVLSPGARGPDNFTLSRLARASGAGTE